MGAWLWTIVAIIISLSFFIFFDSIILFISCENDPCLTYAALKRVTLCHVHFLLPSCALFKQSLKWCSMHCNAKRQIDAITHTHVTYSLNSYREREGETRAVWTSCNRFIISFVRPANEMCAYFRHEIGTKTSDKIMTNRTKRMKTEPIENGMHSLSHTARHTHTHTDTHVHYLHKEHLWCWA